jgi:2-oxoglutarate ferredoxin oxidoreductase subunit gamma
VDELKVPTVEIATRLGNVRCANIVALAAFVARSRVVSLDSLRHCVKSEFAKKPKVIPINMEAIEAGIKAAE